MKNVEDCFPGKKKKQQQNKQKNPDTWYLFVDVDRKDTIELSHSLCQYILLGSFKFRGIEVKLGQLR